MTRGKTKRLQVGFKEMEYNELCKLSRKFRMSKAQVVGYIVQLYILEKEKEKEEICENLNDALKKGAETGFNMDILYKSVTGEVKKLSSKT
jgi:phosphatidylserine/phosphatidylglycerophosphate/cardiolipin synthase-like enzyme